ncbi:MAG: flagellar hook-associated protein FlgK, partial [Deltaproteobacteria bacterium]
MGSLSLTLEIAKNTLLNTQVLIQTSSHNISNADNKAYARQKTMMVSNSPLQMRAGWLGMGAGIDRIIQQRDQFVEKRFMESVSKEADYKARSERLSTIESYFSDNGQEGISQALGAFWDAWEALSTNPGGISEQTYVGQSAQVLVDSIRDSYNQLADFTDSLEQEVQDGTGQVNSLISEIATYNDEIMKAELGADQSANDLRDLRYQALTKLSEWVPVSYTEDSTGSLTVTLEDYSSSITLVSGSQAGSLQYDTTDHRITYLDYQSSSYTPQATPPEPNSLSGGRLNGLLNVFESTKDSHDISFVLSNPDDPSLTYLDRLNAFTATLITQVNNVHMQSGGSAVFDSSVIVSGFKANEIQIDAGFTPDDSQALNLADLQDRTFANIGDSQFGQYLADVQQQLGLQNQNALSLGSFHGSLREQLEA